MDRQDAVQDIMDHPTFEEAFTSIAKGLPDLERIVSRIHARNCKVKDFLKVLGVSCVNNLSTHLYIDMFTGFQKAHQGYGQLGGSV